ncbi:MAG: DsrE family protein [Rhodospirillales bacterium]|nr:DsrE family protein [Rhodospirillales bacterium]
MATKLVVLLANTDPDRPVEVGAPLFQAAAAASMDYAVDVVLTGAPGILMKKGVAQALVLKPGSGKTAYDFIKMAKKAGARFWLCAATADLHGLKAADLIPECDGLAAVTEYVAELMDDECRILTF